MNYNGLVEDIKYYDRCEHVEGGHPDYSYSFLFQSVNRCIAKNRLEAQRKGKSGDQAGGRHRQQVAAAIDGDKGKRKRADTGTV